MYPHLRTSTPVGGHLKNLALIKLKIGKFGDKIMIDHATLAAPSGKDSAKNRVETRTPRTIRFSDSEWKRIDMLAIEQGISSADLVRQTMIAMMNGKFPAWFDTSSTALPAGVLTQIEKIYRGVYVLATLKRDEMYREGKQEELNAIHEDSRRTQELVTHHATVS